MKTDVLNMILCFNLFSIFFFKNVVAHKKFCFGRAWICVTVNTKVFCEYDVTVSNKIIIIIIIIDKNPGLVSFER